MIKEDVAGSPKGPTGAGMTGTQQPTKAQHVSAETQRLFPEGSKLGKGYVVEAVLGEGAYGWVIQARSVRNGQHVAIKKFKVRMLVSMYVDVRT
jgi:serine/threonine protein kinase